MKIILTTETSLAAALLKQQIITAVKGENTEILIDTWSYKRSGDNYDIIYHNPSQYIDSPEKNVLFRVEVDGTEVFFSTAWWINNPQPANEMLCLHTGRLTEMLLSNFSSNFIKFNVVDFIS